MRLSRSSRMACVWLLLAAALLLRAAMPSGWMPSADEDGLRVVLCSGRGPVEMVIPKAGISAQAGHQSGDSAHHGGTGHDDAPHDPCPYGLTLAKAFSVPDALPVPLPPVLGQPLDGERLLAARIAAWRSLRPPARGPPATA